MRAITEQQKQEAIAAFAYEGTLIADTVYGSGHINDTFRLTFAVGNMGDLDVILQRMNADAFPHPEQLMENIAGVTGFLKKKIIARGGDPERETLNIIPTVDNKPYYRDTNGDYWRSYRFITGASSFDQVETPEHCPNSQRAPKTPPSERSCIAATPDFAATAASERIER